METTPTVPQPAHRPGGFAHLARPALVVGLVIVVISGLLLAVVLGLDAFTATVYSVGGKSISDPTPEAAALRDQYAGAKVAAIVGLVLGGVALVGAAVAMYATRGQDAEDDGGGLSFDELAGE
ncbi:hypothetical protein [Sinomonas mesophila]|uniref:hypothetical protein n=1 Tax=Sinomonas mesophila TaxID=1531955 RepID=UPI0009855296|nr:hypothetical protein [Sinomonas mesophila]